MRRAVAARIEMDSTIDTAPANRENGVAGLVCSLVNLESLAAEGEHLGHERHAVEPAIAVERTKDFVLAPDFHPIAYAQFGRFWPHSRILDGGSVFISPITETRL